MGGNVNFAQGILVTNIEHLFETFVVIMNLYRTIYLFKISKCQIYFKMNNQTLKIMFQSFATNVRQQWPTVPVYQLLIFEAKITAIFCEEIDDGDDKNILYF